jgi:hypothetical protein
MFNGYPVKRTNGASECVVEELTRPHFYQLDKQKQIDICHNIEQGTISVVPCHRQQGFDFTQVFNNPQVITVTINDLSFLSRRFAKLHLEIRNKAVLNPMLNQILQRAPEQLDFIIQKDYEIWLRSNRRSTDIEFQLEWINTPVQVASFCQQYNLGYSLDWVNDITLDMKNYAL